MPKKKSVKKAVVKFIDAIGEATEFFEGTKGLKDKLCFWAAEYAIIRLYSDFEIFMLNALVGAVNADPSRYAEFCSLTLPKHMNEDLCTYLIVGPGYFDFRGRDGLLQITKKYVNEDHYLYMTLKDKKYKETLEQLSALRNYSSHRSEKAKQAAMKATGAEKFRSAGEWLRAQGRFEGLCNSLRKMARRIERNAPH
jgi:hypothetical protein